MEDGLQLQQDRLVKLEDAVTQVGARVNVDALVSRLDNVDARVDNARSSIELSVTRIEEALQAASDKERASLSEQRDALAALKAIVLNVAADVALLRALPSPVPKPIDSPPPASEAPVSASANAELPPEVKHQVMALADEDPGTRFSAVDKLLRSRDIKVLPALLPMAKDANTFVRRLTVEGLREFRRADVVETLLVALADPESIVRLTASASLRALTAQRIDFDDTNASTRSAAQRRWQDWWEKNRASFTF